MNPKIFFITGTSGSGKTTLVQRLQGLVPKYVHVHDFDEGGVPKNPDKDWRLQRTEYWLLRAKNYLLEQQTTVVCGVCVPAEIQGSPSFEEGLDIYYGFLSIPEQEIRRRLKERMWEPAEIEGNIAWAKYLEHEVRAQQKHYIIDSERNNPKNVASKVMEWIEKECEF